MERLLEAVLGSFLQDYVHSSKETEGGAFKASWSARGISLHDINININKIKFPRVNLRKATAKSLEVKIPWASLATKAIEVHIVGVELIADGEVRVSGSSGEAPLAKPWDNWPDPSACRYSSSSSDSSSGWVGDSIQSRLLRTALHISVFVDGASIVFFDGAEDSITCQVSSFSLTNLALDELLDFVKNPRCWFNKGLCLQSADLLWNKSGTTVARLCVDSIQISALLPSLLFITTDKHDDQFLIPLGVEVSCIDLDLFDGFLEALREKLLEGAGNQNGEGRDGSDQNYFRSFSSFTDSNGIAWDLDWGLSILSIRVKAHSHDFDHDGVALPDMNLLTVLFQNIIHRCRVEEENVEISFGLGSASIRFYDRKIDKTYDIFAAIPFHDFECEHAFTAAIRADPLGEASVWLNCTKIKLNVPWECETYGKKIMNTVESKFQVSSGGSDVAGPSNAPWLFPEVAIEIHDIDIGVSNQDDRLSLVLKNVHVSKDMLDIVNANACLVFAQLTSLSDGGTATKISNSVHFSFEWTGDGWKYSWDPFRICVENSSALEQLTSCLTGNQNCHNFPSLPVSIKIDIGSDGYTSNAWANNDLLGVSSTVNLAVDADDQSLTFHTCFDIQKAGDELSIFWRVSEFNLVEALNDHRRSILRIFLSDVILKHSRTSKSCLLGCIAIDTLAISSDLSSMLLVFEYLSLYYSKNNHLFSAEKECRDEYQKHQTFRVETLSLTMTSCNQKDAMCIWINDACFVKDLDKEHFHVQDGGLQLRRRHDTVECLSFARPNIISPVIKAIVKSDSVGVDRDLEVLDLEIKIYPCMLTLLNEVMSVKSCWQNTWKNATLSMNPSKLQNSDCFIQSSMVIRIGYLNVSLLQDESSSPEIHLDFRLKEACIHYIQKSLTNQRFWFSRAFNTESDSKLLVSIDSGSVLISGKSGHGSPILSPFSVVLSVYMWPIGNRKFMYASTSHIVFRVDMCTLRDISSMLSSYSPSNNIGDSNYSPDNEVLKLVHSDDDLRLRPSLLSRTCDRTIFDVEVSVEIVVHDISAQSFSWTYRYPRNVNRLQLKDSGMPPFIGSCFKLSRVDPLEDEEIVVKTFKVDSNDFMLCLKTVEASCEWRLSWDKKLEEDDLSSLLKSISISSSNAELRQSSLNCSISFSFAAPKITAVFCAIGWPFGECLGARGGMNVLSELSWLQPNISMASFDQQIRVSGSGTFFLDYTDPFVFTPLRLLDCTDLTANYTCMQQDGNISRDNDDVLICSSSETVDIYQLCLASDSGINLITGRYVLYDLRYLWKLASEEFPFYPLTIRNNSSSQVSIKQLGCDEEVKLGINDEKRYPLHHDKPKLLQFSSQSQSKPTWSRGVRIFQEQSLRISIPPTGVMRVKLVRTSSGGVVVTLNDGLHLKNSTTKLTFVRLNGEELRLDPGQKCSAPSTECEIQIKLSIGWSEVFCLDSESKIVEAENVTQTLQVDSFPTPPLLVNSSRNCVSDSVYHICYPVTLKNSLSQNLAISGRTDRAETAILLQESSMDLILKESGGKVCTVSREEDRHEGEKCIGLFCPGYATQEGGDSGNQISHLTTTEILAPAPGRCMRLSLPPGVVDGDAKKPTTVILQSWITPYNTLELKFSNELYLNNATCKELKFMIDNTEVLIHPFQTSGINASMANFLTVSVRPFDNSSDVWCTSPIIDITMSSQMIIDVTNPVIQQSLKLFIDIDINSQGPSKIMLKPFYYISNLTSYVLSHGVEEVFENETKPLLSPLDFGAQSIKIRKMKRGTDGKMILVHYLMLPIQETHQGGASLQDLACKMVRKRDKIHFIVLPYSNELVVRNMLDVQTWITVLSGDMELMRSYLVEQGVERTLHLGHSEASLQIKLNENSHTIEAVTKIPVGEVVRYQQFVIRRTNVNAIEIRHAGQSYKPRISRYSLACSRFSVSHHSNPQSLGEDRILELGFDGISGSLQTNSALEMFSVEFGIDKLSIVLDAFLKRKDIVTAEGPAVNMNCQGFLTDIKKHHKIDAIEGSLGTLLVAIDDATIESLINIWGNFGVDEVQGDPADDAFIELQEIRKTPVTCIDKFLLKPINMLVDSHLSRSAWLPFAINTSRAPISVGAISYEGERNVYEIVRLLREDVGDSLFRSAPYLLGSLQLLFDPVGMLRSLRRGFSSMVNLPVEGIRKKSLSSFLSGVGHGSANFFKEISGWSYGTALGFSKSIVDILRRSPSLVESSRMGNGGELMEESDVRISRPLVYGVQNLVSLSSKLGTVFWYRNILEAQVSLKTDPKVSIKIVTPVLLIHDQGLVVFAHWGRTASFQILSTSESRICVVNNGTHEVIIESDHCRTFSDQESQQSQPRESIIKLSFEPDDFDAVSLVFEEVWGNH